ncbi:hypothetical protein KAU45_10645, partial [bacterium]|nr:hypothetical protein [bacterium]
MIFIISNFSHDNFWTIVTAIGSICTAVTLIFIIFKYIKDRGNAYWEQVNFSIQELSKQMILVKDEFTDNTFEYCTGFKNV